ncbi:hypothetical protein EON65_42725 [archaeon]|nr:MAG: hypothetical protein EON65_42725 [archaeon]
MSSVQARRPSLLLQERKIKKKTLSYWQKIVHWYDNFMFDYFPPSQDFPPLLRQPFGFMFLAGTIVIFVTLFVTGFNQAKSKVFLAPAQSAEGLCKPVPVANTGAFLGTTEGFWQGSRNFSFAKAAYVVTMNDLSITESEYVDVFTDIEGAMRSIGVIAKVSDLSFNILLWSAFVLADESGSVTQRFYMTGEPMQILDREFTDATVASPLHSCAASNTVRFDTNNARLRVDWDYEPFSSPSSHCMDIMSPDIFGYNAFASSNSFSMQIDMRTVMVGAAVNYGIIAHAALTLLPDLREEIVFTSQGNSSPITFIIDRFVDPRYPGMSPLTCIVSPGPTICVIIVGYVPTLPFFFHTGKSLEKPDPCVCNALSTSELDDSFHPCHAFNFMAGLLFYNTEDPAPLFELSTRSSINSYRSQAFLATWYASSFGKISNATAEQREAAFEFCSSSTYGNCSIMTFSFYDMFRAVSIKLL